MQGSQARSLRPIVEPQTILMPSELCIYRDETCTQFVQAMQTLSVSALSNRRPVVLDLSQTKRITAGAAVMLFAEVTRAQLVTGIPDIVTIKRPKNRAIWQLVRTSGLWDAIRPGGEKKLDSLWEKKCPFASGNDPTRLTGTVRQRHSGVHPECRPSCIRLQSAKRCRRSRTTMVAIRLHHTGRRTVYDL